MDIKAEELECVKGLSNRIVEAQRKIRILDLIKWNESVKEDFLKHKGKKPP